MGWCTLVRSSGASAVGLHLQPHTVRSTCYVVQFASPKSSVTILHVWSFEVNTHALPA